MRNVDALIVDSSYTDAEYAKKAGWGHGTYGAALKLAREVQTKKLFLTHHEPTRDDRELEAIFREEVTKAGPTEFEIVLAREGIEHVL